MNLKEFIEKNRIEPVEFAFKCGISVSSIYRYIKGSKMHRRTAKIIEEFTQKQVTFEELMGYENR